MKGRFLNRIGINKIRQSGKSFAKRQCKECTNGRLKSIGRFLPWTLGFPHGEVGDFHQNKKNGRRTEMQFGISIRKIVLRFPSSSFLSCSFFFSFTFAFSIRNLGIHFKRVGGCRSFRVEDHSRLMTIANQNFVPFDQHILDFSLSTFSILAYVAFFVRISVGIDTIFRVQMSL